MSSSEDAERVQSPPLPVSGESISVSRLRQAVSDGLSNDSVSSLPNTVPSVSSPTPATSIIPERITRSLSPTGRVRLDRSSIGSTLINQIDDSDNTRTIIIRGFSPVVAVYASPDTDELAKRKGFRHGFTELIRPFGEKLPGKIVVRDSVGASRAWDDFTVKFVDLPQIVDAAHQLRDTPPESTFGLLEEDIEEHVEKGLDEENEDYFTNSFNKRDSAPASPWYQLFLRRLITGSPVSTHETFSHPVTCVIAISSQNDSPIESLRQLYMQTSQGSKVLPPWGNPEYLRYYVLVHDEDRDDLAKSNALFDQMKRHFGLHCHMLRLRSVQAVLPEADIVPTVQCEWLTPSEDLNRIRKPHDLMDVEKSEPHIFESDGAAIKTFVRELVAQSVVPHMENRIALWNEQVASRRRGLSGRFMSISKRWTGFGSSRNVSSLTSGSGGTSGNYDSLQGFYGAEAPEAILRKMADYSFMLRDYKLAASTYDMLRSDFNNDKAWRYLAGANEMCVISNLLNPLAAASKIKVENLDQMLETATYSYLTRCSDPHNTLRCIAICVELLRTRSKGGAQLSAKWAIRVLELNLMGSVGRTLASERVAACFMAHIGSGPSGWGSRQRKAAFWYVMAAEAWLKLGKATVAALCLEQADWLYKNVSKSEHVLPYPEMQAFLDQLRLAVKMKTTSGDPASEAHFETERDTLLPEEVSEKLDTRQHRRSLIAPVNNTYDVGPLSPTHLMKDTKISRNDDFE
ncbi:putative trapp complex protein trs85 [Phaeomoniella chlamydospora]|uniref:Putative trapp complex protein trs85 n=1 Tax=Phaeomoniella chlamydospora TaxID=158046 RepID=A0A0G2EFB9_PHACM|nr:putative trapp complex protein trs85 [Phaeomoniella chlamydospora]